MIHILMRIFFVFFFVGFTDETEVIRAKSKDKGRKNKATVAVVYEDEDDGI